MASRTFKSRTTKASHRHNFRNALLLFGVGSLNCFLNGCNLASDSESEVPEDTPRFLVPSEYRPDVGKRRGASVEIRSREFAFGISAEELAANIQRYEPIHYGIRQDLNVIVNVYVPSVYDHWEPPDSVVTGWEDIWNMTGNRVTACIGDKKDAVSGYYRYYNYCDPEPHPNSNFFLMDRVPDSSLPRPESQDYIKGTCRDNAPTVRLGAHRHEISDDVEEYIGCIVSGRTGTKERFRYRLKGQNIALKDEVDQYIRLLLESWYQSVSTVIPSRPSNK